MAKRPRDAGVKRVGPVTFAWRYCTRPDRHGTDSGSQTLSLTTKLRHLSLHRRSTARMPRRATSPPGRESCLRRDQAATLHSIIAERTGRGVDRQRASH